MFPPSSGLVSWAWAPSVSIFNITTVYSFRTEIRSVLWLMLAYSVIILFVTFIYRVLEDVRQYFIILWRP